MKIGGFQKTSLLDYPEEISAIIWTVGCNFNCPFCYNRDIVKGDVNFFSEDEILGFLEKRKGLLEGLVVTGGEPFLQEDLAGFLGRVKKIGYLVKIDTNGTFPDRLKKMIDERLVDYVAMDIKAPKSKYEKLVGKKVDISKINKSIDILKNIDVDHEFRTTIVPGMLDKKDIIEIGKWLKGSKRFFLQQFKNDVPLISKKLENVKPFSKEELLGFIEEVKPFFDICDVRGI